MRQRAGARDPYARVLDWLARRDRSEREIREKLRHWDADSEEIEDVLAKLTDRGLVDDRAFAQKLASWHERHDPVGPARLKMKLQQRGVSADLAAEAAESLRDLEKQRRLAMGLVRKRLPSLLSLGPEVRVRRLSGYLARRGFAESLIRELCHPLYREDLSLEDFENDP